MEWKEFIALLTGHLAWPVVALIILLNLKGELGSILQRVARLKYKDLEMDFKNLQKISESLPEKTRESLKQFSPAAASLEEQVLESVESAPSAAVLLAWSGLEVALASAVSRLAISPGSPSYRSPMHNIEMLQQQGYLSPNQKNAINELRMLRNKLAHEQNTVFSISSKHAKDYAELSIEMAKYLETLKPKG